LDWGSTTRPCKSVANRLKAIDVDVSDEDTIVVLTAGLPPSYTPIVISFDALESTKLTLVFIITRLLNEEGRQAIPSFTSLDIKTEDPDINIIALNASKFHSDIQCFYCLPVMKGHYTSESATVTAIEVVEEEDYAFMAVVDEEI
jgi:hypothetical protein